MANQDEQQVFDERSLYNIGAVTRMTGIPIPTLRVWERRYDFPEPDRTSGGHRIYSEYEVARLKWVKAHIDGGMQTRQAIEALKHMEEEGEFPPESKRMVPRRMPPRSPDGSLATFQKQLGEALLAQDRVRADQVLGEIMALYPLEDLILHVIQPTMVDVGEAWFEGRITVAAEHMATNYLRHRLVMWMFTGPPAHRVNPIILACAPGEWHEGSLLMLGVLLRRRRWPVNYLGQSLPLEDLAEYVRATRPAAVVVVAMGEDSAEALSEWPGYLPEVAEKGEPPFGFGGQIFSREPAWRDRVQGVFLGETLTEGVEKLDDLLRERLLPPLEMV